MSRAIGVPIACLLLGLLACVDAGTRPAPERSTAPEPAADQVAATTGDRRPGRAAATPSEPSAQPADDMPTQAQLPVAEDFEAEVTAAIDARNYRSELDALEREFGTDSP